MMILQKKNYILIFKKKIWKYSNYNPDYNQSAWKLIRERKKKYGTAVQDAGKNDLSF